jgi:hypothetical protein
VTSDFREMKHANFGRGSSHQELSMMCSQFVAGKWNICKGKVIRYFRFIMLVSIIHVFNVGLWGHTVV